MSSQIQELIDKIKSDGVATAEKEAAKILEQAKDDAAKIIEKANADAEHLLSSAKDEIKKNEESSRKALQQSSRDMLLSLRKEIDSLLKKIIKDQVDDALTSENLVAILSDLMGESMKDEYQSADIKIALSPKDLKAFEDGFTAKLQEAIQKEINVESSEDVSKGFTISFDGGKSCFDFTDESLVEYLSVYLNEYVSGILKDSV